MHQICCAIDVETFQKILGACSAGRVLAGGLQQSAGFHSPAVLPRAEEEKKHPCGHTTAVFPRRGRDDATV